MRTSFAPHTHLIRSAYTGECCSVLGPPISIRTLPREEDYTREKVVGGVTAGEMVKIDVLTQSVFDCDLLESVAIQTQAPQSLDVFLDRPDLMPLAVKLLEVFGGPSLSAQESL